MALQHYCQLHGHANVPQSATYRCEVPGENGVPIVYIGNLGKWLTKQRQGRKGHGVKLHSDREALLQKLVDEGKLLWDATCMKTNPLNEPSWETHYAALLQYMSEFGHCNVPHEATYSCQINVACGGQQDEQYMTVEYHGHLGRWVSKQRQLYKGKQAGKERDASKLIPEHEMLLQQLVDQGIHDSVDLRCRALLS
jgi:hypothetical protein